MRKPGRKAHSMLHISTRVYTSNQYLREGSVFSVSNRAGLVVEESRLIQSNGQIYFSSLLKI